MAEQPPGITITRVFDAPREHLWSEWTEVERFADWFGGPESDVPLVSAAMDVRPGGAWSLTMFTGPARRESRWRGEYREVDAPERLVFTMSDDPDSDVFGVVTVVLTDIGDGRTEMHFEQRGPLPPAAYEAARRGWGRFFDRIAERLA
jgi:uncharacterized protein YndB with AHSA1/START domain